MVRFAAAAFWSEPRPKQPPPARGVQDRILASAVAVLTTSDALLRSEQSWRAVAVLLGLSLAWLIYVRRQYPFGAFLAAFGCAFAADLVAIATGAPWQGPPSHAFLLLLPYTLFRWGAGREKAVGVLVLLTGYVLAALSGEMRTIEEAIGGAVIMMFPAALGASFRFRASEQARQLGQVRSLERESLARELHDTVAHYVSAIAVQAQAGQAVAEKDPRRALETLGVIEQAASKTLDEMRDIVGALRDSGEAELAPHKGLSDLDDLKTLGQPVEITLEGPLDELHPAVGSALYRMAQEAVTNASRHARNLSGIWIRVRGDGGSVQLTVTDDGEGASGAEGRMGFGLLGLAERAALLGGRFEAGPGAGRGWRVSAELPRQPGRAAEGLETRRGGGLRTESRGGEG